MKTVDSLTGWRYGLPQFDRSRPRVTIRRAGPTRTSREMHMREYDVVVAGAGNAALCAAISAHENGARVLVLERAPEAERGGNSYLTAGGFRFVPERAEG